MRRQRAEHPLRLHSTAAARKFLAGCFGACSAEQELIWVAHLDDQNQCVHLSRYDGDRCAAVLPIRQIITDAAMLGSAGIILAHNHPSGDCRPSQSDLRATRRLASVADAIECTVFDHFVFGGGNCTSFRQLGLL